MINNRLVYREHISIRLFWFIFMASLPLSGWTAVDSSHLNHTESTLLKAASTSMQRIDILDMTTVVPDSWQTVTPSSKMRLGQFSMSGEGQGEVIVFYFGAGQGGSPQANIARWVSQFRPVNGKPVQPMVTNMKTFGGFLVTWVVIQGDYARGVGMGPIGEYKSDQMLIAAVTQTPRGNLYFQFHGDRATILNHRNEFAQFVLRLQ